MVSADDRPCDLLILGASFAGIELYHQLRASRAGRKLHITLVDRQAVHGYIPLCQERIVGHSPVPPTTRTASPHAKISGCVGCSVGKHCKVGPTSR